MSLSPDMPRHYGCRHMPAPAADVYACFAPRALRRDAMLDARHDATTL